MNYLKLWTDYKINQKSMKLEKRIEVEGVRSKHLGPRFEYAKINLLIEPAENFEVVFVPKEYESDNNIKQMLDAALFGFLDIVMNIDPYPLKDIKVTIFEADIDQIDSSIMSFKNAGKDAGRKVLEILKK